MRQTSERQKNRITKIAIIGMLSAVAFVLQYIEVSIPIVPSFLKLDFSDVPELIGAFSVGPWGGVLIALIKNLLHLPFGSSSGVGELANFLLGAVFSLTAGYLYRIKKTKLMAIIASLAGALAMALVSIPINYFLVYPTYAVLGFGGDMSKIIGLYQLILPSSDTLIKSLLIFNLPFTFAKGLICALITFWIYKPLSRAFFKMDEKIAKKS